MANTVDSVQGALIKNVPYSKFEYVTVTFPAVANTAIDVGHSLAPPDANNVDYEVVRADRACRVYDDQSGTRRTWQTNYIVLKCDTASAVVQLRLSLRRT